MQPRHHVSASAVALIKRFEGFRRSAAQLPDGRWTIGYGHTRSAREGVRIDEADASALLLFDLGEVSVALNELIFTPLTQNQFDALASFAMNIGVDAFRRSSVLLRINEGALLQAASAVEMWRTADFEGERIVVDALVRRRAAEKALFLTPTHGYVPTPTPVVRPRLDHLVNPNELMAAVVELTAPLEGEIAVARRDDTTGAADAQDRQAESPSSTEAAAAVNVRLQAILDDLDLHEAARDRQSEAGPTPAPIVLPLPDPSAHARRALEDSPVEPFPEPLAQPLESDAQPFGQEPQEQTEPFGVASFDASRIEPAPSSYLPLAVMLLVGVALLAVATYWFVAAHPRMGGVAPSIIGWVLGLTGIALLASSIYFLLERIGGQEQD
jgi:lysozyme